MRQPRNSGEWATAIARELKDGHISDAEALTAFRLSTVVNWSPKEPQRQGRPALYWKNATAAEYLGIKWRSFERHRAGLRKAGLIDTWGRDLVPVLPVKPDAANIDAVKSDGPYEEHLFKEDLSRSSYEVEIATASGGGGLDSERASAPHPWASTGDSPGPATPEGGATTAAMASWGLQAPIMRP